MIILELRAEFNEYFQSPDAELILWLDPSSQWKGVIEHLKKEFRLVEYKGSQLEVKAEVELTRAEGKRPKFVLYLPGLDRDKLTVLKEYEFSGKVFEESILRCFRRWGVDFDREHEAELAKIFPVLVTRFATKGRDFWRDRLIPENVRALLFDSETVRKMLASPDITAKELQEAGAYEIFCDFVKDRFGGPNPREFDPFTWAQRFTTYLILTEVRAGSSEHSSVPRFDIAWADERHEAECLAFVKDWMRNATYREDFKIIVNEVEKGYDLSPWAAGLSGAPTCETSISVEKIFEKNILSRVNNIKSLDGLRSILSGESETIDQMAGHFWSCEGEIVTWQALRLANEIVEAIDQGIKEIVKAGSASLLARRYAENWWKIDRDYRTYRARYDGEDKLSKLSTQIASIYRGFQDQLNEKFLNMMGPQGTSAIEGMEQQSSFWTRNIIPSKRKRAVFLVDALRFELACDLKERLQKLLGNSLIKCIPSIASIPTLTPIGMASIVSGEEIEINLMADGNWHIKSVRKGESGNISVKDDRRNILKKRHTKAAFYDLEDILKPSELNIGDGNPVVVFTREMDGLGHDSGVLNISLDYIGQYLDGLVRAIRRLGSIGIEEVHIVSDHGFLIVDEVTEADKVTIPKEGEILYKGHRCLVGKDLPEELGIVLGLPNSAGLQLCIPRGTGIFRARDGKQFFHGGLSLQEFIVPHIEVVFTKAQPKYGVKLKAPEIIRNLIFEAELLRAIPAGGVLFGAPRFIEIYGMLVKEGREIFRQSGPDMIINQANESLRVRLRIKPGIVFSYGDILRLELKDADTGELLDSSEVRIEVESHE